MSSARSRLVVALLVTASAWLATDVAFSEDTNLDSLRRKLERARSEPAVDEALDALTARIGKSPGFEDAGAFGDWLGELPSKIADRPRVQLRRGWAYLAARRPAKAKALLEKVRTRGGEAAGVALAYLGETARQEGELASAIELLTEAVRAGYRDTFVMESAQKAAFQMRQAKPSKEFEGLPEYATAIDRFLAASEHPVLRAAVARWLLDDYGAYAKPGSERARTWADAAAKHALAAAQTTPGSGANARLAYDAAEALAPADGELDGKTHRWDLMAWAYRLGNKPETDSHEIPQVLARLAKMALRDGRYEVAYRMARKRLEISDSPAARRVLHALPPDLGD